MTSLIHEIEGLYRSLLKLGHLYGSSIIGIAEGIAETIYYIIGTMIFIGFQSRLMHLGGGCASLWLELYNHFAERISDHDKYR